MRLTCPNCNAQYEVEDSVIPAAGRDVQCSACGHSWFQYPAEIALQMRAADLDDDDDTDAPAAMTEAAPRVDRAVLDVLREEAERELTARRTRAPLETQGDLGLTATRARPTAPAEPPAPAQPVRPSSRRRNLLPDIEELSTTLEPGDQPRRTAADVKPGPLPPTSAQERSGFRRGFSVVALIAIALTGLYLLSGTIAQAVPALTDPLRGYVALVDLLRQTLSDQVRAVLQQVFS